MGILILCQLYLLVVHFCIESEQPKAGGKGHFKLRLGVLQCKQFCLLWLPRAVDFKVSNLKIPRRAFAGI
jgi:hypothetical protein